MALSLFVQRFLLLYNDTWLKDLLSLPFELVITVRAYWSPKSWNVKNNDIIIHLAANADVRFGLDNPYRDIEQNTLATFNVLEAMRLHKIKKIIFSSTGSIYGESEIIPTPENAPFPIQTSMYGSSKLACEGLIQSYCEG